MKTLFALSLSILLVLVPAGCVYKEGIQQPDQKSYLWFTGRTTNAIAIIDEGDPINVEKGYYYNKQAASGKIDKKGRMLYQVKPGKHEIVVKLKDEIRVHRVVLIGSGETKEINIP